MSEMMLSFFPVTSRLSYLQPIKTFVWCVLYFRIKTPIWSSRIFWSKCGQITAKLQTSESVDIEDQGGICLAYTRKTNNFPAEEETAAVSRQL